MNVLLATFALLANGIAAGIMVSTVIGIVPMMLTLPYERYVRTVQFLWPRYDPVMPMMNGLTVLLDAVLVIVTDGPARAAFGCSFLLLVTVMAISITKNVPINRYVKALDPDRRPGGWERDDPRRRWRNWNTTRTCLAVAAFAVNVTAVVLVV